MSWISENYEKAAIGGAAVVALGIGALVLSNKDAVKEATVLPTAKPDNDVSISGLPAITDAKNSLGVKHVIIHQDLDGRKVGLFTGVPLFAKKGDPKNPVDLLKSQPVHPGIPNIWWLENGIDPGFSDSPDRDPDEDGFSNREEFVAKTDPKDEKKYPDPIAKLSVKGVKTTQVHIRPSDFGGGQFMFRLQTKAGVRIGKMGAAPIKEGSDITFEGKFEKLNNRFKFETLEEKEMVKSGIRQKVKIWVLKDKKPNKAGGTYRIDRQGNPGILDSTVELNLNALQQDGKTFKVEENTKFSLPFDEAAKEKPYLLKKVDLENKKVEIEYTDKEGNKKAVLLDF